MSYYTDITGGGYDDVVVVQEGSSLSSISLCCIITLLFLVILAVIGYFGYPFFIKNSTVGTADILIPNKGYLVNVTNTPASAQKCIEGTTYGMNATGEFYIDKGCSGIFIYTPDGINKRLGVCTSGDLTTKTFSTSRSMQPAMYPSAPTQTGASSNPLYILPSLNNIPNYSSLTGFIDMKNENLSILEQNGNCRPGNYGFYGNNMIFAQNGCKGTFVLGPLIGRCESSSPTENKTCPIGSLDLSGQGLTLGDIKPFDTSSYCNQGNNYGFKSINKAFRDPTACQIGGITFGTYNIACNDKDETCPLNANTIKIQ